jgi:hypothetical protein
MNKQGEKMMLMNSKGERGKGKSFIPGASTLLRYYEYHKKTQGVPQKCTH